MLKRVLLLTLMVAGFTSVHAQDVDEIIANYFEVTGGADNWKSLKSIKMTANMSMGQMEFPATIMSIPPDKQRVEIDIAGKKIIQAYDGETAWMINPMMGSEAPQKMPAEQAEQMTSQKFEDELLNYKEKGHSVALEGTQEVEGTECYKVKLTKKNGDVEFHYFDTENNVRIMQEMTVKSGPAKGQSVQTFFSDYQEVTGFYFPFFIDAKVAGQSVQKITISKLALNEEIDGAVFSFPED